MDGELKKQVYYFTIFLFTTLILLQIYGLHADRIEAPHVEMYFKDIEDLEVIADRWTRYDKTGELDWWLVKGPQFYLHNT